MTTMQGIQREAIRRAQRGEWDLADALELDQRLRDDSHIHPPVFGLRMGGRLQLIVFVNLDDLDGVEGERLDTLRETSEPEIDWDEVARIENLNGEVIYDAEDGSRPPYEIDNGEPLNLAWAESILNDYRDSLAKAPPQASLNLSEAA